MTFGLTSSDDSSSELETFLTIFGAFLTYFEGFLAFGFGSSDSYSDDDSAFFAACFATALVFFISFLDGATIGTLSYS